MSRAGNVAEKRPIAAPVLPLGALIGGPGPWTCGAARSRARWVTFRYISALSALAAFVGCAPEPRPSPLWGGDPLIPPLSTYVERPDLADRLRTIDAETRDLGLVMTFEVRGKLAGASGVVVVRSYEGKNALGRTTHAVRVATPRGVIMAAGPQVYPLNDAASEATELVPALIPDSADGKTGAFQAGTDINGDGDPDVVLRAASGALEVWRLGPLGASRYEIRCEAPPTSALDIDEDGEADLICFIASAPGDRLKPTLTDYAVWDGHQYSDMAPGAKAEHTKAAEALEALLKKQAEPPVDDVTRLTRAIELAWHVILSGEPRKAALERLDKEPVPPALRADFAKYRAIVERVLSH